ITAGASTLPKPIPIPIRTVPIYSHEIPMTERTITPISINHKATKIVFSNPKRLLVFAANNETIANAINGTTVITLTALLDMAKYCLISNNATPIELIVSLSVASTINKAINNNQSNDFTFLLFYILSTLLNYFHK